MIADPETMSGLVPGTVLNVNDHEQQRYVVSKILRNAGYRVIEASNGQAAIELALAEAPDVVVLDVQLPDISGMEVCRRLKRDTAASSPLVLHTSATFAGTEIRVRGLDVGGDAFLAQPFTTQELVATVRALIRRRRVEEDQRRRAEQLAEADRRKDDFLAMLGHELRNPLNALAMSQSIVDQFPARDPAEVRAREVARRQTAHLTRLVNDLLDVSRVTRGKIALSLQVIDLIEVITEAVGVLSATTLTARDQTIEVSLPDYPVAVDGDRVRLAQVFANLLENASKYSPAGSRIGLDVDVDYEAAEPSATITITDQGQGIAEEQMPHVFDLFYQAHPTEARIGTGLGIGLTLVRALIDLHGGGITARSEGVDRGSEFEVRLPIRPDRSVVRAPDTRPTSARRRRTARESQTVLIVEDNDDARDLLTTLCRSWGYQVVAAANGLEGLEIALTQRAFLAFVDIGLPGIDGYELARRVRASLPRGQLLLIALTGYGLPAQRQKAMEAGFDHHLVKPAAPELLEALLEQPQRTIERLSARRPPEDAREVEHPA